MSEPLISPFISKHFSPFTSTFSLDISKDFACPPILPVRSESSPAISAAESSISSFCHWSFAIVYTIYWSFSFTVYISISVPTLVPIIFMSTAPLAWLSPDLRSMSISISIWMPIVVVSSPISISIFMFATTDSVSFMFFAMSFNKFSGVAFFPHPDISAAVIIAAIPSVTNLFLRFFIPFPPRYI